MARPALPSAPTGNQHSSSFFAHMIAKFKNSPHERAFGRVQYALLPYGPEQRGIPMDFKSDLTRQDSLLQKSLNLPLRS